MQVNRCFYNLRTNQTIAIFILYSSHVSSVSIVTRLVYGAYEMELNFWKEHVSSVFSKTSRAALESHLASYSVGTWDLFSRGKEVDCKTDNLPPSSNEVVIEWNSTSFLPLCLHSVHRDNVPHLCSLQYNNASIVTSRLLVYKRKTH
jgi:hypothetical protein